MHEASLYDENCFVTLTYAPRENGYRAQQELCTKPKSGRELPTSAPDALKGANVARGDNSRPEGGPESGLSKSDHQKFMKRLRKHTGKKVRFFMCGEYGEKLQRPHYHYILFGYDFPDRYPWRGSGDQQQYRSKTLEKLWPHGHCEIGTVTFESCAYVARYVTKKIDGELAHEHYRRTSPEGTDYWLTPEFGLMSRKPGIAGEWIDRYKDDVYNYDNVIVRGAKARPPRYYDTRMGKTDEHRLARIKARREEKTKTLPSKTQRQRRTEETITRARLALKQRVL